MMYVTGDTHLNIDIEKLNTRKFVEGKTLTKDDILIICGDVGLTWDRSNEVKYWKDWLNKKPWTTICCDGNHENFNELYTYPLVPWNGGYVRKISDSVFYLNRGDVFNINGKKFLLWVEQHLLIKIIELKGEVGGKKKCQIIKNKNML